MQIKRLMLRNEGMRRLLEQHRLPFTLRLPDKLQIGCIAKEYRESGVSILALDQLYHKYIDSETAHLEINVHSALRNTLRREFAPFSDISMKMSDEQALCVMQLLESAALEVAHLMNDSFLRFRRTDAFRDFVAHSEAQSKALQSASSPALPSLISSASSRIESIVTRFDSLRESQRMSRTNSLKKMAIARTSSLRKLSRTSSLRKMAMDGD